MKTYRLIILFSLALLGCVESIFTAGCIAAELEELFDTLDEDDFASITSYLGNIPVALQKLKTYRQYDVATQAFMNVCKDKRQTVDSVENTFEQKLLFLKGKGIRDPTKNITKTLDCH